MEKPYECWPFAAPARCLQVVAGTGRARASSRAARRARQPSRAGGPARRPARSCPVPAPPMTATRRWWRRHVEHFQLISRHLVDAVLVLFGDAEQACLPRQHPFEGGLERDASRRVERLEPLALVVDGPQHGRRRRLQLAASNRHLSRAIRRLPVLADARVGECDQMRCPHLRQYRGRPTEKAQQHVLCVLRLRDRTVDLVLAGAGRLPPLPLFAADRPSFDLDNGYAMSGPSDEDVDLPLLAAFGQPHAGKQRAFLGKLVPQRFEDRPLTVTVRLASPGRADSTEAWGWFSRPRARSRRASGWPGVRTQLSAENGRESSGEMGVRQFAVRAALMCTAGCVGCSPLG